MLDYWNVKESGLATFLQRNPQIKRLTCRFPRNNDAAKEVLRVIIENSNIEDLFMYANGTSAMVNNGGISNFKLCLNELKALDNREQFKRLEIFLSADVCLENVVDSLSSLNKLTGLYYNRWLDRCDGIKVVQSCIHLTVLELSHSKLSKEDADGLAISLRNLEELYLSYQPVYIEVLRSFVRHCKHLYKIGIILYFVDMTELKENDVLELNKDRNKLDGARKLTIYWESFGNKMISSKLVDVKHTKLHYNDSTDRPNPFMTKYFKGV